MHKKYVSPVTALCVCKETHSFSVECGFLVVVDVVDGFFLFVSFFVFFLALQMIIKVADKLL